MQNELIGVNAHRTVAFAQQRRGAVRSVVARAVARIRAKIILWKHAFQPPQAEIVGTVDIILHRALLVRADEVALPWPAAVKQMHRPVGVVCVAGAVFRVRLQNVGGDVIEAVIGHRFQQLVIAGLFQINVKRCGPFGLFGISKFL